MAPYMLSRDEAARYCGVSLSTFKRWMADGLVAPVDLPWLRRSLFRRSDLELFLAGLPLRTRRT